MITSGPLRHLGRCVLGSGGMSHVGSDFVLGGIRRFLKCEVSLKKEGRKLQQSPHVKAGTCYTVVAGSGVGPTQVRSGLRCPAVVRQCEMEDQEEYQVR